jgi:hypothetical protein
MLSTLHSSAGFLVTAPFAMARTKQKVRPRQRESISSRNGSAEQTDRLLPMNEFEVFSGTPRKRTKPTVPLDNVLVSHASTSTPVDLFDALFKYPSFSRGQTDISRGPFSATGIYTESADCAIPCNQPTPCAVQSSNVAKFAIEEASTSNPPGVKIYFEGGLAWYEIISVHPSYASIFADMRLKARLWLWVQHRRSAILTKSSTRKRWPTLKQISHDVPWHLKTRIHDPIDTFHAYLIEQILQSHLEQEKLAVGPPDVDPKWSKCQLFLDLEEKYPVCLYSVR